MAPKIAQLGVTRATIDCRLMEGGATDGRHMPTQVLAFFVLVCHRVQSATWRAAAFQQHSVVQFLSDAFDTSPPTQSPDRPLGPPGGGEAHRADHRLDFVLDDAHEMSDFTQAFIRTGGRGPGGSGRIVSAEHGSVVVAAGVSLMTAFVPIHMRSDMTFSTQPTDTDGGLQLTLTPDGPFMIWLASRGDATLQWRVAVFAPAGELDGGVRPLTESTITLHVSEITAASSGSETPLRSGRQHASPVSTVQQTTMVSPYSLTVSQPATRLCRLRSVAQLREVATHYYRFLIASQFDTRRFCPLHASKLRVPLLLADGMRSPLMDAVVAFLRDVQRSVVMSSASSTTATMTTESSKRSVLSDLGAPDSGNSPPQLRRRRTLAEAALDVSSTPQTIANGRSFQGARRRGSTPSTDTAAAATFMDPELMLRVLTAMVGGDDVRRGWALDWYDVLLVASIETAAWPSLLSLMSAFNSQRAVYNGCDAGARSTAAAGPSANSSIRSHRDVKATDVTWQPTEDVLMNVLAAADASTPLPDHVLSSRRETLRRNRKLIARICEGGVSNMTASRVIWSLLPRELIHFALHYVDSSDIALLSTPARAKRRLRALWHAAVIGDESAQNVAARYFCAWRVEVKSRRDEQRRKQTIGSAIERRMAVGNLRLKYFLRWLRFAKQQRAGKRPTAIKV